MPLFEMSTNIQLSESPSRKRNHDRFSETPLKVEESTVKSLEIKEEDASAINGSLQDVPSVSVAERDTKRERSPSMSSDSELSIRDSPSPIPMDEFTPSTSPLAPPHITTSATKAPNSLKPNASALPQATTIPASAATAGGAPAKKKRKTAAEKEAEEKERTLKKAKREEEAAARAKEKEEKEATKAKEKEEKEAARAAKAAEKAKVVAEKEEKERKKREEEDKKKRAQPTLFGFLKSKPAVLGDVSPNKQSSLPSKTVDSSPIHPKAPLTYPVIASAIAAKEVTEVKEAKPEKSTYQKMFQPFYVKPDVKLAPTPFLMDNETMLAKSNILDGYVSGQRGDVAVKPFDPVSTFQFNGPPTKRGKQHLAVKKIMAEIFGDPLDTAPNTRTESQQVRLTSVQDQLSSIPVKVLSFWEDVRPPYIGTVTSTPEVKLHQLARRPNGRLLQLNYDYDSEAEWEEEEGEDLDDEEADDEENDGEEEMDDFLDDAEDVAAARPAFLGDAEPVSTGICYEDRKRSSHNANGEDCATVYKYRMEFLLESLEHHHSIDPFSTEYWQPKITPVTSCTQSKISSSMKPAKAGMAPPPVPGSSAQAQPDWSTLVPKSMLHDFKRAVINPEINFLTKVGIADMLSKKFSSATKNQVKATLDFVAERSSLPGAKKSNKVWVLRPEHALDKD